MNARRDVAEDRPCAENPWQVLLEVSTKSYYSGDLANGRWACETLLSLPDVPKNAESQTRINQIFYSPLLDEMLSVEGTRAVLFEVPPLSSRFNPSIAATPNGFRAVVRTADFNTDLSDPWYRSFARDGKYHFANYLVDLDPDLNVRCAAKISHGSDLAQGSAEVAKALTDWNITDCRLFRWHDQWYVSGSMLDGYPDLPTSMVLLRLDGTTFHDLVLLSDPAIKKDEKNWMPVVRGDDLLFVYSISPTVVLRYTPNGIEELIRHPGPYVLRHYRGGSQGLDLGDGYLFVIHESVLLDNRTRAYPHRFVRTDADFHVTHVSTPFFFLARYVEFCCGMALRDDDLVISFGFMDREAYVSRTTLDEILALLRAVYG